MSSSRSRWAVAPLALAALLAASPVRAAVPDPRSLATNAFDDSNAQATGESLVGIFAIDEGQCDGGNATGSYFRMIQPGGDPKNGPFIDNGNSNCSDKSYTTMRPGADGGLATSGYQENPDPAFDNTGGSRADRIFEPLNFQGVAYGGSTNPKDPQTGADVPVPSIVHDGSGHLTGEVQAVSVGWNRQHFNQGAPKPDGSTPSLTRTPKGSYDAGTRAFVIEWTSTIKGGPFDGFTGLWHLEGTFLPDEEPAPARSGSGSGSSGSSETQGSSSDNSVARNDGSTANASSGAGDQVLGASAQSDAAKKKDLPFTGPAISPFLGTLALFAGAFGLVAHSLIRRRGTVRG